MSSKPLPTLVDRSSPIASGSAYGPSRPFQLYQESDLNNAVPSALPPMPDKYEIPSLRRKPYTDPPNQPSLTHTRSYSHPFPSLFGSKRADKNKTSQETNPTPPDRSELSREATIPTNPPRTPTRVGSQRTDRQPVTGKCMACDSTVRWPQGLKVYRCTTCLTINDLEPYEEKRSAANPVTGQVYSSSRKPSPLSTGRTRKIIDECIAAYLVQHLEGDGSAVQDDDLPVDTFFLGNGSPPEGLLYAQIQDTANSPRSKVPIRSPSESKISRKLTSRCNDGLPPSEDFPDLRSQQDYSRTPVDPSQAVSESAGGFDTGKPDSTKELGNIFRPLENYISESFTGCAVLNSSFFTIKPTLEVESRPTQRAQISRAHSHSGTARPAEPNMFLSDLDVKTVLLGDVAENGSWWLGGRSGKSNFLNPHERDPSPERWRGAVGVKAPRINWIELAEWYRLVLHAGDSWKRVWEELRPPAVGLRQRRWSTTLTDELQRQISESQVHLQRSLLKATENLLKRPMRPLKNPDDCRFLMMLLANPLLHAPSRQTVSLHASGVRPNPSKKSRGQNGDTTSPKKSASSSSRSMGGLGHHSGVVKRILGLMANLSNDVHQFLISWLSRLTDSHFQKIVDLVSSFMTYRLSRQQNRPVIEPLNPTEGLVPSFSDSGVSHPSQLHAALEIRPTSSSKNKDGKPKLASYSEDWQVRAAARVMGLLFQANTGHTSRKRDPSISNEQRMLSPGLNARFQAQVHGQMVPISSFYNTMLDYADLVADFEAWESTKTKFTFCQYPFFLSIWAKIHILEHDARRQMEVKAREAFFDSILSRKAISQYLVLKVRRDCLVEDSLRNVGEVIGSGAGDIKKGLRIDFVGEEGIDAGGLRKEWFLLLVREIFDPEHGLFVYDEDSQYCYFNAFCFESSEQFFLVGVLLGLAIYNSTILDVAFPPFVFKKMLASAPVSADKLISAPKLSRSYSLEDLAELRPALARGLRQLLEYEGNVQEVFCRDFVAETDRYGELVRVPLCPRGEKKAVTNENRREFVDLYIHYLLDTAVARQYEPFKRGFFTVCGGNALSLFRPEEIELLVRGSDEPLDIASLRAVATYEGWPKGSDPEQQAQVIWFWEFFERASPGDQRKILSFITGSDRIPAMGATNLVIRVQLLKHARRDDPDFVHEAERFPIARTCFNTVSLYRYETRHKLEEKLWTAVCWSEGFGLK